ncbi:MAG TPA: hypothetical protein VJ729_01365 [Nitrososphaeraceae archaeon]|jgi:hypothetical protein|nr:hypothetical protein [Nitrososphaeraceae archaeon]
MLAKGPELKMKIIPTQLHEVSYAVRMIVSKGKKNLFKDDILLDDVDVHGLGRYIRENFDPKQQSDICALTTYHMQ